MSTFAERFGWVFEERKTNPNELSERAGLARSYLRNLLKAEKDGRDIRPGADALDKIARAANVSFLWLSKGDGPREPYQGTVSAATTPAPPASETRVVLDAVADMINSAYDPTRHLPSDAILVGEALQITATFKRAHVDAAAYVRRLLDAAARERQRGRKVAPADLPTVALGVIGEQLDERDERVKRLQEELARAYDWMRERGVSPPEDAATLAQQKASVEPPRRPGSGQHHAR